MSFNGFICGECRVFSCIRFLLWSSIIAETTQAEHIEHLVKPVKIYLALFFVSVGMMIDQMLVKYAIPVEY
jgi:hypothetical protein